MSATSKSAGSPFGWGFADPMAAAAILQGAPSTIYDLGAGGYKFADHPATATHAAGPYYKGGNPARFGPFDTGGGGDPNANRAIGNIYAQLGDLPRVAQGSKASMAAGTGGAPVAGPTVNEQLRSAGINTPWGGPWEFPGWHLGS